MTSLLNRFFTLPFVRWFRKPALFVHGYVQFLRDYLRFSRMSHLSAGRFRLRWRNRNPCLYDRRQHTDFDRHYLFHMAWAARVLAGVKPTIHIDVSSSMYFPAIVSAFVPVEYYEFRPTDLGLSNLSARRGDLLALPFPDQSVRSLSCMHVIEHVGLGRYGDTVDPDGDMNAIAELKRILAHDGNLLFVVPVGTPSIQFNAHRIYSYRQIMEYFQEFELKEFALIPDRAGDGGLLINTTEQMANEQKYGCGCFWFRRPGRKE